MKKDFRNWFRNLLKQRRTKRILKAILITTCIIAVVVPLSRYLSFVFRIQYGSYGASILIKRDSDFTNKYNFEGDGTESNPYLITNLNINVPRKNGIIVTGTTKHFIISNCTIYSGIFCIYVSRIATNTCIITENKCIALERVRWYNDQGLIKIEKTNGILVSKNYCFDGFSNRFGIQIEYVDFITLESNFISGSSNGINAKYMNDSIIINNNCTGCGRGIILWKAHRLNITSNFCGYSNKDGMKISACFDAEISNNVVHRNYWHGIYLGGCRRITVFNNNLSLNNRTGLYLTYTINSTIFNNNFYSNGITYHDPQIYQAYDNEISNLWYNLLTLSGNYWDDLVWDDVVIYEIDGGNSTDPYPLENPVSV